MSVYPTPLYDKLLKEKGNGVKLDFNSLDKDTLYELWSQEYVSDRLIAELYGVKKSQVTYKRRKFNVGIHIITVHWYSKH